jgi:hypothetical protein
MARPYFSGWFYRHPINLIPIGSICYSNHNRGSWGGWEETSSLYFSNIMALYVFYKTKKKNKSIIILKKLQELKTKDLKQMHIYSLLSTNFFTIFPLFIFLIWFSSYNSIRVGLHLNCYWRKINKLLKNLTNK